MQSRVLRRIVLILAALLALAILFFFTTLPTIVAKSMNGRLDTKLSPVVPDAAELHKSLFVADLHADTLLWRRDLNKRGSWGHVDIPRLIEGNVALQTFSIVSKTPRGLNYERNTADSDSITLLTIAQTWPPRTWNSLLQRSLYQAEKLYRFAEESNGKLTVIRSQKELGDYLKRRTQDSQITAGWLSIEGAQVLEADLNNLDRLYEAGFRMVAPTHFFDTAISGSKHGVKKQGLTTMGRKWIKAMEQKQMIVDLSHASNATINDVLEMATRPVIVSHTGVSGTCQNNRNLSDDQIKRIAENGGLIGIGFWPSALCGNDTQAIVRAIQYVKDLVGIEHVAYGSDFDGAVKTPIDSSEMVQLTQALLNQGFTPEETKRVAGQNILDFLLTNLPKETL